MIQEIKKTRTVTAPFDGRELGVVKLSDDKAVEDALSRAHDLHKNNNKLSLDQRIDVLRKAMQIMKKRENSLAIQAANEGGKPLIDSKVEIARAIDGVEVCIETLRTEQGHVITMRLNEGSGGRLDFTQIFPIGPVVAVSAFNHPYNLIAHQCVPAIATGCPVLVKPAEATPLSAESFAEVMREAGLPEGWCQVMNTTSLDVATKLVTDPRVGFFSFIGSGGVGWRLRSQLAPGTRCALEHGGVAPVIVTADADLDRASQLITKGGFYHAGQVCVSVQRVFVHEDIFSKLAEILKEQAEQLVVGDPSENDTEVGPLIKHKEADRVESWVDEAVQSGGTLATGGIRLSESTFSPTIILNPDPNTQLAANEVFGPVIALFKYTSLDEAIMRANSLAYGFQAAIFTKDIENAMKAFANLKASAVMINDHTAFRTDWMPFAGLGVSGHGVGGMSHTMHEMSFEKMLVMNSPSLSHI